MQGNIFKIPTSRTNPSAASGSNPGLRGNVRFKGTSGSHHGLQGNAHSHGTGKSNASFLVPCLAALVLAYLSTANASFHTQVYFSGALLVTLFLMRLLGGESQFARITFLAISSFLILRYFFWRTLYTVEYTEWISFTCAILLYLAEIYGIVVALTGNFVNVAPLEREPVPLPETGILPSVDVFIPSYNESPDLLETTLIGALQMRYQEGRKTVYLLDDGGTDEKCNGGSQESREIARTRRKILQQLCEELGAVYFTRPQNRAAKAGNINEGIRRTEGDLLVVFDADHVPTEDFLEKTVGLFLEDPKLFLVQTPHFFLNPDPIERNLNTFHRMPSENEMFYQVIQKGLDFWNSAFFCGSGAVMSRQCIESIGGISSNTITEDAETALTLHAKGYNSAYVSTPLLSGLAPETMSGFISQRSRWAQGMTQIFLLKCPLFIPGLTLAQRLCYFNSCFFWLFPFARLVYMLAPAAFLVFGLRVYAANVETFCSYSIPYLIAILTTSNFLYGKARWSFISELYELIQSIHTIPAILSTLISPRAPVFKVTPKGEKLSEDFISPVAAPFYLLAIVNILSLGAGVYQFINGSDQIYPLSITLFWGAFNTIILMSALGALFERRQLRGTPRVGTGISAELIVEGNVLPCHIEDLSLGGCKLSLPLGSEEYLANTTRGILRVFPVRDPVSTDLHVEFRNYREGVSRDFSLGVEFTPKDLEEKIAKVRLVIGDSDRWAAIQKSRESNLGVFGAFLTLTGIGFARFFPHLGHMWAELFGFSGNRDKKARRKTLNHV